jgi:hypothetical protein
MRLLGRVAGIAGSSAVGAAAMEGPARAPLPPRDTSRGGRQRETEMEKKGLTGGPHM